MTEGHLLKMRVTLEQPVNYEVRLDDALVPLTAHVGKEIQLKFNGKIACVSCQRSIKKTFGDGLCFPCFKTSPLASECIIRPELCRAHLGEGRDPAWEKENHLQPHVVYLAVSSSLKVGVTRIDQIPTRWIDQGAIRALVIARTANRYEAGLIEVALKNHFNDRTDWRKMLRSQDVDAPDLEKTRAKCEDLMPKKLRSHFSTEDEVVQIEYPVSTYPEKIKSLKLDKLSEIGGTLLGIKGQYLMFEEGRVLNIRKHSGYHVELDLRAG